MATLLRFLRNLLLRAPAEILLVLLRLLVQLVLLLPLLLAWLWECLWRLIKHKDLYPESTKEPCGELPEGVVRRPDPCIYSQKYLQSQGVPVTWNNPDIWVAPASDPGAIEPDSYHLEANTDYIVTVRVHNASATDPAIGVRVRLVYRPWSFSTPDLVPVETDAGGNEVFRFVSVPPMSSAEAQFKWHTPALAPGETSKHFCIQARLFHPMDTNPSNNMGQENTQVHRGEANAVAPGDELRVAVPLFNRAAEPHRFRFEATRYEIEDESIELRLKTTRGRSRRGATGRIANFQPSFHVKAPPEALADVDRPTRIDFQARPRVVAVRSRYTGYDEYKNRLLSQDFTPHGIGIRINNQPLEEGVEIAGRANQELELVIKVPPEAPSGRIPLNIVALTQRGALVGGVTILVDVGGRT